MGQKVNPNSLRLNITRTWDSIWFAGKRDYARLLHNDIAIRKFLAAKAKDAGVAKIEIKRNGKITTIDVHVAKPGLMIGRQGAAVEDLKKELATKFSENFDVNILEIKKPDLESAIVAESVAHQISRRIAYRRAAKMAIQRAMEGGAKGIKIAIAGRLNGAEIARSEFFKEGNIPLHTLRADVSYADNRAETMYGTIGVKVWIYRGEVFKARAAA